MKITSTQVNFNDQCIVELTERGKEILEKPQFKCYMDYNYNKDTNFLKVSLWELFEIFGNDVWHGCQIPFAHNIITILNEQE
jgi:hypothetical protein